MLRGGEFSLLRKNLAEAYTSLCAAHSAITSAWGQPLSLFKRAARDAEEEAADEAEPEVALEVVEGAKRLVERAAALEDLADVYDAQLQLATGAGAGASATRCVRRGPVQALEAELEELSLKLSGRIAALLRAKEALETNQPLAEVEAFEDAGCDPEDFPLAILQERQLLGELWRVGAGRMEVLARVIARRSGQTPPAAKEGEESPNYSSYVHDYL
ncbi:unnamed protein product [Effrenium voratum]|nr:unnamed protein product [Effrenium voratum]